MCTRLEWRYRVAATFGDIGCLDSCDRQCIWRDDVDIRPTMYVAGRPIVHCTGIGRAEEGR